MKKLVSKKDIVNNDKLKKLFERYKDIRIVYLFGSFAHGMEGILSDIDLAVLFDESVDHKKRFQLQLELIGKLVDILEVEKIDLTIINEATLTLKYEIIKANTPVFVRDLEDKIDFEHYILSRYLDRRYYEKRASKEFLERIAKTEI
ncbi:MAG: nucleotidyltransferase domain-containing protein [Candidatus Lokiarchaeota archaeon]|nr:nucleotidyltransferase domain-containing protein [Candidatus Lokiarchaeota archaeon]